jgi:transcriptional regulator with XRE-family HTH domain
MTDHTDNQAKPARKRVRTAGSPTAFGVRLRTERAKMDKSQAELGKLTGVNKLTIQSLEVGRSRQPTWSTYQKLLGAIPALAGTLDETRLEGWYPAEGVRGPGVANKPQVRLLRAVAGVAAKGALSEAQEMLDAAHAEGLGLPELLSVVTAT